MTKPLGCCCVLLIGLQAGTASAQARPDSPMRERALPGNVLIQREVAGSAILEHREWQSPRPGPRRAEQPVPPATTPKPASPAPLVSSGGKLRKAQVIDAKPDVTPAPSDETPFALARAWDAFTRGDDATAAALFEDIARSEGVDAASARHGLALLALRQSRLDEAENLGQSLPPDYAERAPLLRDIAIARAQAHYAAGRHPEAGQSLATAAGHAPLPRHARALEAWNLLAMQQNGVAAARFETLYRETPDAESADGVMLSFIRANREVDLAVLAGEEPLASRYRRHLAERAFAEKRFIAARDLDPVRHGTSGSVGTTSAELALARREKSATGLSETALEWGPSLNLRCPGGNEDEWNLRAESLRVSSPGRLGQRIPAVTGTQAQISWRSDAAQRWKAAIGTTPSGGPVTPEWEALLARTLGLGSGTLRLAGYRQSNRESMLSYVGMRDPTSGRPWGRVLMQGLQAAWRGQIGERWSASLQARHEDIVGEGVAANRRDVFDGGVGYDLKLDGFDYAVVSLNVVDDRFARNLSHFTPGHGGYFSPQSYSRIGPAFDFMTAERQAYMLKGRMAVGNTGQQEAAAPVLPLADNGLRYGESSIRGRAWEFDIGGAWQVSPRIELGGWISYRKSPDYEDRAAMISLRLLFDPRTSVLSSDLPNANAARLF